MAMLYLVPRWFYGVDIAFELVFAVVTFLVALYAFYMYRLSAERECKLLSFGFIAVSISYLSWALVNLFITEKLLDGSRELSLEALSWLGMLGVYAHVLFLTLGFATLAYVTFNVRNNRVYALFVSLTLIIVVFSYQKALTFYFVSALLLFYVALHYGIRYYKNRNLTTLLVFMGFLFLFLANAGFAFSFYQHVSYVAGHVLLLFGYALILIGLAKTIRL